VFNDDTNNTNIDQYNNNQPQYTQNSNNHNKRPPPISTDWQNSLSMEQEEEDIETANNNTDTNYNNNGARVSFNIPVDNNNNNSSSMQFQNPKRYNTYPTQSLRRPGAATNNNLEEIGSTEVIETNQQTVGIIQQNNKPNPPSREVSATSTLSSTDSTPAFLRRAAQQQQETIPPNSIMHRSNNNNNNNNHNNIESIPESSFYGADASALDGTFVSIRDLGDDDDVPSINDVCMSPSKNSNVVGRGGSSSDASSFPTESTSLLGEGMAKVSGGVKVGLSWQGGFFGNQMDKEDKRARRKLRRNGLISNVVMTVKSLFHGGTGNNSMSSHSNDNIRGANQSWEQHHPIGGENFMTHPNSREIQQTIASFHGGGLARQRIFSLFMICILCLHFALCGMHDLFLRYIAYRNPQDNDDEVNVSWNGEGQYTPAYYLSFDGRVMNPLIGPGARTLTAFGACVPGLVLSKGQGWRVFTSLFESSSFVQLLLHIWTLKTAIGGSSFGTQGLEWKRGTFTVVSLYLISALIGIAWSIAIEPGRLITASCMGISGLLAASIIERACFPLASKDEDNDVAGISSKLQNGYDNVPNNNGGGAVASSSNEQFTFQPPNAQKKNRFHRPSLNSSSPSILLILELLFSWWGAYTSLPGTVLSAMMGGACALLLFVGSPPPGSIDSIANQEDLLFNEEETPPPPPPLRYVNDDDSLDTTSIGSDKHAYKTPLMRRSILGEEDDEEEPLGMRATLRKRNVNGSSSFKTPGGFKGRMVSINNSKQTFSASRVVSRLVGILICLLLTLIPASLIATGTSPSSELTRASVLGCKPMRILYKEDANNNVFECAGGCIPLSREGTARRKEGMKSGRCDTVGYQCYQQSGTMTLRNHEATIGIYSFPSENGCDKSEGDQYSNNEANDNEADAAQADNGDADNGEGAE